MKSLFYLYDLITEKKLPFCSGKHVFRPVCVTFSSSSLCWILCCFGSNSSSSEALFFLAVEAPESPEFVESPESAESPESVAFEPGASVGGAANSSLSSSVKGSLESLGLPWYALTWQREPTSL